MTGRAYQKVKDRDLFPSRHGGTSAAGARQWVVVCEVLGARGWVLSHYLILDKNQHLDHSVKEPDAVMAKNRQNADMSDGL